MTDKLRELTLLALDSHGCERLKDFYECGPVQRAAVETFLEAVLAQQDAQAVPQGYKMVPVEPTQAMLDAGRWSECIEESSRMRDVDDNEVRMVWFDMLNAAPTPTAQRVMLTDDEIDEQWFKHASSVTCTHDFARAVIEAYERKNGIK